MRLFAASRLCRISVVSALVFVVGCSDGGTGVDTTSVPSSLPAESTSTTHGPVRTVPPFVEVTVELSSDGTHLVDAGGRSLYLFTLDDDRNSACEGPCEDAWPPLLGDPVAGDGVDQALLGKVERSNGSIQVMYAGHPLYRYSGDAAAGDTNGQGFNDVWFLVGPDGERLEP